MTNTPDNEQIPPTILPITVVGVMSPEEWIDNWVDTVVRGRTVTECGQSDDGVPESSRDRRESAVFIIITIIVPKTSWSHQIGSFYGIIVAIKGELDTKR